MKTQPAITKANKAKASKAKAYGDPATIFGRLYESGAWDSGKAGSSGRGSSAEERKPYVDAVVSWLGTWGAKTVVDLGCGDGKVLADIASQYPKAKYTGVDVYAKHLNMLRHTLKHHQWKNLDIANVAKLPAADVWLCKDVLHHWPSEMIREFLQEITTTKPCKHLVLCFDVNQRFAGEDTALGSYRALNTEWEPFAGILGATEQRVNFLHKSVLAVRIK